VARRRFQCDGYSAVTLRSIAGEAGVDVALIGYFFGSKRGLFGATLGLAANPPDVLVAALPGELARLPERLLSALLGTWDDPTRGNQVRITVTAALADADLSRLVAEILEREMIGRIADRIGGPAATVRASAASAHLAGLVFTRYVLRVEPLASLPPDQVVRRFAPALRAVLFPPAARPDEGRGRGPGRQNC
jgi:AcrR family transcriptional regulator